MPGDRREPPGTEPLETTCSAVVIPELLELLHGPLGPPIDLIQRRLVAQRLPPVIGVIRAEGRARGDPRPAAFPLAAAGAGLMLAPGGGPLQALTAHLSFVAPLAGASPFGALGSITWI